MQGSASPRDKRPLFAQGVIYDSPPTSPYGQGESPRQHFAPFSSPGIRSPHSSPRYSTPNYSNYPRPPKFPRDFQGASPRSPWSPQGYSGSPRHQHYSQNRRSSGFRGGGSGGNSWSSSFQSGFRSPRYSGGGHSESYVKDSMVEDPWAHLELKRGIGVKQEQPQEASELAPTSERESITRLNPTSEGDTAPPDATSHPEEAAVAGRSKNMTQAAVAPDSPSHSTQQKHDGTADAADSSKQQESLSPTL